MKRTEHKPVCSRVLRSTSTEKQYLKFIFQAILRTKKGPPPETIALAFRKPVAHVLNVLDRLERNDLLLRRTGTHEIVSIYPLSLVPTEHQILLEDGTMLFAMCALDALGMPVAFSRNVTIVSRCEKCTQKITVEIKNDAIAHTSHPNTIIWSPQQLRVPAAETCCPLVNFFCSREHLDDWIKENPDSTGNITGILQAFSTITQGWRIYGETLGFR